MPFNDSAGTRYFYFERLREAGLTHGIFTRHGGVSPEPWGSLNAGSLVGDAPERVAENLERACRALGRDPDGLRFVRQVHGNDVYVVMDAAADAGTVGDRLQPETLRTADAIVTASPAVTPAMRFADCVPILLYDPVAGAAGIAHAGWRGTLLNAGGSAIAAMHRVFGSEPSDVLAGIGPSICLDHYEVGPEVVGEVRKVFGDAVDQVVRTSDGRRFFDLRNANRLLLAAAGVREIEVSEACTAESPERWFSLRAESGRTGRFAAVVGLSDG
jgi:YfiH family protein